MRSLPSDALPPLPGLLIKGIATLLRRQTLVLPNTGFAGHFELASIDMGHVAKYRKLFDNRGTNVPLTYFYLLAQRAQLALMLDERFPHTIPGLIHTRNDMRLHAIPLAGSCLEMDVSVLPRQDVGDVQKIVFNVEIKQSGLCMVSCVSEYRVPRKNRIRRAGQAEPEKLPDSFSQTGWTFEKLHIRRYAMVSGDYNPIHLSSLLARASGFTRAIAHGMYSVGRAAASIECQTARQVIAISADFRRPIHLPARATFGFESPSTTQGAYGVLLAGEQKLALGGVWEIGTERRGFR